MGFRTSFYHYPIEFLDNAKLCKIYDDPDDETSAYYTDWEITDKDDHELLYDAFTNSILDISDDPEYCSHIFPETDDPDASLYLRMNKEQFAKFIKYILKNYVKYQTEHRIEFSEFEKLNEELSYGYDYNKSKTGDYSKLDVIDKLIYNQHTYNMTSGYFAADLSYFDDILKDPWKVSRCWGTQQAITNMFHIYHMMDWNKEEILVIGC